MSLRIQSVLVFLAYLTIPIQSQIDKNDMKLEYATSVAAIVKLLKIEKDLIQNFGDYVELMQQKIDTLNMVLSKLSEVHGNKIEDPEAYLSNPLNSFALIRRMHMDWKKYHELVKQSIGQDKIDFISSLQNKLPDAEDYKEAQTGIYRLQDTYILNETDFAAGILYGKQYNAKFSLLECYAMGQFYGNEKAYEVATKWFKVSLKYYEKPLEKVYEVLGVTLADIWYNIADQLTENNENIEGLEAINKALELRPNDKNFHLFRRELVDFLAYEKLCSEQTLANGKELFCRYNTKTSPFLKLAPMKMEEISLDPYVLLYHDMIYDREIKELKEIAVPKMERSLVGQFIVPTERIGNIYYFEANDSVVVNRINRRVGDMTGLNLFYSEELCLFNYGIGGHHYVHTDHFKEYSEEINPENGNRNFVIVLYLQDVILGGATIFPVLNVAVPIRKATALVFPTLDKQGNGESRTLHASCPIIIGSKWSLLKSFRTGYPFNG